MKMRIIIVLMLTVNICCAQSKNELQKGNNKNQFRIYYGFTSSDLLRSEDLDGDAGYENGKSFNAGVRYLRKLSRKLSLETGVAFFKTDVKITPAFAGEPRDARKEDLNLVSIPVYLNYSLGKYFFINGGPFVDFQSGDKSFDKQSGIGYSIGFGVKYNYKRFVFYAAPFFKRHAWIPFKEERYHQKLTESGVQIGIGYQF